jgi:hypothetical protein
MTLSKFDVRHGSWRLGKTSRLKSAYIMESRSAKGFTVFGELMIRNLWSDNCMFESMYSFAKFEREVIHE